MDFKVIFKETFLEDLERVIERIAVHDPSAARKLGEAIVATAESLSFFPERHPNPRKQNRSIQLSILPGSASK